MLQVTALHTSGRPCPFPNPTARRALPLENPDLLTTGGTLNPQPCSTPTQVQLPLSGSFLGCYGLAEEGKGQGERRRQHQGREMTEPKGEKREEARKRLEKKGRKRT